MSGYASRILGTASSALQAQQAAIAATSNNIANVNTPGYVRRTITFETRQGGNGGLGVAVGDGVTIQGVTRDSDKYLEQILQTATAESSSAEAQDGFLDRIQNLFSLDDKAQTVGSTLTDFFSSVNDLANNPSSIELRSNMVQKANDLVNTLKNTYNALGSMQDEIDQRLGSELSTVNSITSQIAKLNEQVAAKEVGGRIGTAVDERDARDVLLNKLAGKISFQSVEQNDGSVNLSLANGFNLVSGSNAKAIEFTNQPSFATNAPASVSGGLLGYAVYNYGDGTTRNDFDLTTALKSGQGTIGGLLRIRGTNDVNNTSAFQGEGTIPQIAAQLEGITKSLLTDVNATYLGADANHRSVDLDGNVPPTYGLFDFTYGGNKDAGSTPGVPDIGDLNAVLGTGLVKNFTSLLKVTSDDPRKIAAAVDTSGNATGPVTYATGDGNNLLALSKIQNKAFSIGAGSYTSTNSLIGTYNNTVTLVGNLKAASTTATSVSKTNLNAAQDKRDSFSAVNLDEEFTGLIANQQAYQAAARMIRTANDLFDQLLNLL